MEVTAWLVSVFDDPDFLLTVVLNLDIVLI
jgi:hypothetical protein